MYCVVGRMFWCVFVVVDYLVFCGYGGGGVFLWLLLCCVGRGVCCVGCGG